MMRRIATTAVILFLAAMAVSAGGQQEGGATGGTGGGSGAEVDYLGVAAVMIRDGNYDRAVAALSNVDLSDEDTDITRYYTLSGLVNLRVGDAAAATDDFEAAIAAGQDDPVINVYLAQAYYSSERYEDTLDAISRVNNLNQFPALYAVRAEAEWRLGDTGRAFDTVSRAIELFPSQTQFLRQRIFYLIDLDLTQEAVAQSQEYLARLEDDPDAYVTIGEALRRGGATQLAIQTLETGRIRYPGNERVLLALGQAYLTAEMPRAAARMVEEAASYGNNALYHEAAEIYRRAGELPKALFLNSQIIDQEQKAVQRFKLLIAMERYEEALALEPRLVQFGATSDDSVRYTLAYALFQTGQFERSQEYVNAITGSEFFRRATQLRRAIETVRAQDYRYF